VRWSDARQVRGLEDREVKEDDRDVMELDNMDVREM
jgi:hypothetical protein